MVEIPAQFREWVIGVTVAVGAVLGLRRYSSKVSRDVSKDTAESQIYETTVRDVVADRERWRETAEQFAKENAQLRVDITRVEADLRHFKAQRAQEMQLIKRYPDLAKLFSPSGPGALDTKPPEDG